VLVVAAALSSMSGGKLAVAGPKVLGHLLFQDLFEDSFHGLGHSGFDILLRGAGELFFLGQVFLLARLTNY
jgi:hypothetical protein